MNVCILGNTYIVQRYNEQKLVDYEKNIVEFNSLQFKTCYLLKVCKPTFTIKILSIPTICLQLMCTFSKYPNQLILQLDK